MCTAAGSLSAALEQKAAYRQSVVLLRHLTPSLRGPLASLKGDQEGLGKSEVPSESPRAA